jgi:putative oxidoreductase
MAHASHDRTWPPKQLPYNLEHGTNQIMDANNSTPTTAQTNAALLCIRIASALAFLFHGSQILFGAFGGRGPQGFAQSMHMPVIIGYLVGLAQFAGGLAIITGVLTRIGAICIIIVMLGAIFLVHITHGFDIGKRGIEYALTQLLIGVALLITGAGEYSLTSRLPEQWRKW